MINLTSKTVGEMTLSELANFLGQSVPIQNPQTPPMAKPTSSPKYVYGLKGLAELLGCCKQTAFNIKRSGKIDPAIRQVGKLLIIDADLALELASNKTGGRKMR